MDIRTMVGSSSEVRADKDFYKTPEWCTREILKREIFRPLDIIWECACGDGAISKILLENYPNTKSSDIQNRGFGKQKDFLTYFYHANSIVTNPPYNLAQQFVEHALEVTDDRVVMLLKLAFLEGQKRKQFFKSTPLKTVYVFSKRIDFGRNGEPGKGSGLLAYAWYVWDHNYSGKPMIEWI